MVWVLCCQLPKHPPACLKLEMNMISIGASRVSRSSVKVKETSFCTGEFIVFFTALFRLPFRLGDIYLPQSQCNWEIQENVSSFRICWTLAFDICRWTWNVYFQSWSKINNGVSLSKILYYSSLTLVYVKITVRLRSATSLSVSDRSE